jgi:hypothetical protein
MTISQHPESAAEPVREQPPPGRQPRSLKKVSLILILSAAAFLLLVVWQRDHRIRRDAMAWADRVALEIREHLASHGTLPSQLTDPLARRPTLTVPYPAGPQLPIAAAAGEPLILVAGPRLGLIQPGGDGCAAIQIAEGVIETRWLSWAEAKQARQTRADRLPGG